MLKSGKLRIYSMSTDTYWHQAVLTTSAFMWLMSPSCCFTNVLVVLWLVVTFGVIWRVANEMNIPGIPRPQLVRCWMSKNQRLQLLSQRSVIMIIPITSFCNLQCHPVFRKKARSREARPWASSILISVFQSQSLPRPSRMGKCHRTTF